jgi:hypothetical protein
MTDKEKADCLIELHKGQLEHYNGTRTLEFKINLTFWSLIVIGAYYIKKEIVFNPWSNCNHLFWYIVVSLIMICTHLFLWMKPIQRSEDVDDYFINQYRHEVEKLSDIKIKPFDGKRRVKQHWVLFVTGITTFLLVIVGVYLSL